MSKELEKLKTIRHIHDTECGKDESMNNAFDIIEKTLKASEIAFKKGLNTPHRELIKSSENYAEYEKKIEEMFALRVDAFKFEIKYSQEEYDLVKEVLL